MTSSTAGRTRVRPPTRGEDALDEVDADAEGEDPGDEDAGEDA
jgi:hypothetical protein